MSFGISGILVIGSCLPSLVTSEGIKEELEEEEVEGLWRGPRCTWDAP